MKNKLLYFVSTLLLLFALSCNEDAPVVPKILSFELYLSKDSLNIGDTLIISTNINNYDFNKINTVSIGSYSKTFYKKSDTSFYVVIDKSDSTNYVTLKYDNTDIKSIKKLVVVERKKNEEEKKPEPKEYKINVSISGIELSGYSKYYKTYPPNTAFSQNENITGNFNLLIDIINCQNNQSQKIKTTNYNQINFICYNKVPGLFDISSGQLIKYNIDTISKSFKFFEVLNGSAEHITGTNKENIAKGSTKYIKLLNLDYQEYKRNNDTVEVIAKISTNNIVDIYYNWGSKYDYDKPSYIASENSLYKIIKTENAELKLIIIELK